MLHFSYPQEVFQEVPGEITLAISVSGCPLNCKGCHSQETHNPSFGMELNIKSLRELIDRYKHITTVLFYGGEWNLIELKVLLTEFKAQNLKTALYSGRDLNFFKKEILELLDFLKVGRYIESLGPLTSIKTNQKF